jgi:hypothetical protein
MQEASEAGIKLFSKWSFDDVEVKDLSLIDYIQVRSPVYLPHTAGRYQIKRFRKAQVHTHRTTIPIPSFPLLVPDRGTSDQQPDDARTQQRQETDGRPYR